MSWSNSRYLVGFFSFISVKNDLHWSSWFRLNFLSLCFCVSSSFLQNFSSFIRASNVITDLMLCWYITLCCHYNRFAYVNLKRLDFKRQFVVNQNNVYQLERWLIISAKDFFLHSDHYVTLYIHLNIQKYLNNYAWNSV